MSKLQSKENRIHSSAEKPYSFYECIIPDLFAYVPMHWHEEFEISYIIDGSADFICGDKKFISHKGDIIITQPDVAHSIYPHMNSRQIYDTLVFSSELFGKSDSDRYIQNCIFPIVNGNLRLQSHITPEHCYYDELHTIIRNIFSCARGNTPQLDMLMRSELIRLFWLLETDAEEIEPDAKENDIIRTAILYIQNNFRENITVRQLADSVHLSQSYFMALFRKSVGFSAIEYILHYRINYACKRLTDTSENISDIAYDSGFRNLSNFNRQFMKIMGCTPIQYKNKSRTQRIKNI
ncbi:MAG: helix-turn-helix domain-containing protein [Oscillospiraceae bacterium]